MDISMIVDGIANQGIWCALFVWLFWTSRQESNDREGKLMSVIESYNEKLNNIVDALDSINFKIEKFHGKEEE